MQRTSRLRTLIVAVVLGHLGLVVDKAATGQATEQGRKHWAFQALSRPAVPMVKDRAKVGTPVDAFVLARLESKGLSFSAEADRRTLLRRVSFDLLGLPPSPEEVEAFVQDTAPDAYEKVLERLLASPHFGERWGRHWLDGAGYVDVMGTDNDAGIISLAENKWRYRDYVVRVFNQDKPFDRFLTEQLAGDELVDWRRAPKFTPQIQDLLIATGFLRTAADSTDSVELNTPDIRHGVLHRTIETVAGNLLGLTLTCARCHDHKYEPISQEDYYRFQALFQPAFNPDKWLRPQQRQIPEVSPAEKTESDWQSAESNRPVRTFGNLQVVYDVGPPTPTHLLKRGNHLRPGKEVQPGFFSVLSGSRGAGILACQKPADKMSVPRSATASTPNMPVQAQAKTSGRRLALARWLTQPDTPAAGLVLRVRVNRVWQHLFGTGLATSSDNFGVSGSPPSHPELLDWLAAEFLAKKQHLKPLLKLIMSSSVYRQASITPLASQEKGQGEGALSPLAPRGRGVGGEGADPAKVDPENRLLWRMRLRRLESESIRDSILAVSGKLERALGGPPIPVEARPDGMVLVKIKGLPDPASQWRRSLYLLQRRNYHPTLLAAFDQPFLTTNCTGRTSSPVVLQTLTMLNDTFVLEQACFLAERVERLLMSAPLEEGKASAAKRSNKAFLLVLGRPPRATEMALSLALLQRQTAHYQALKRPPEQAGQKALGHLGHMLLNTSEFLYIP